MRDKNVSCRTADIWNQKCSDIRMNCRLFLTMAKSIRKTDKLFFFAFYGIEYLV